MDVNNIEPYIYWPAYAALVEAYPRLAAQIENLIVFAVALTIVSRRSRGWRLLLFFGTIAILHPHTCTLNLVDAKTKNLQWQRELKAYWKAKRSGLTPPEPADPYQRSMTNWTNSGMFYYSWYLVFLSFVFSFIIIYSIRWPFLILRYCWRTWRRWQTSRTNRAC